MFLCEICNKPADIHHIVHRCQGGLDIEINYKYLCEKHHRGKNGPHHCLEIDIKYKLDLQKKLFELLPNEYYSFKQISKTLNISYNIMKKITKSMKQYKEGYSKQDIILYLMGGIFYSEEHLEKLKIDKLIKDT